MNSVTARLSAAIGLETTTAAITLIDFAVLVLVCKVCLPAFALLVRVCVSYGILRGWSGQFIKIHQKSFSCPSHVSLHWSWIERDLLSVETYHSRHSHSRHDSNTLRSMSDNEKPTGGEDQKPGGEPITIRVRDQVRWIFNNAFAVMHPKNVIYCFVLTHLCKP